MKFTRASELQVRAVPWVFQVKSLDGVFGNIKLFCSSGESYFLRTALHDRRLRLHVFVFLSTVVCVFVHPHDTEFLNAFS